MTSEDLRSELDKEPFIPFRVHLVSGKMVDVPTVSQGHRLQNALLVFQRNGRTGYDTIAYRNIERVEQLIPGEGLDRVVGPIGDSDVS